MQTTAFLSACVVAALVFLQGTPAPPAAIPIAIGTGVTISGGLGMLGGILSDPHKGSNKNSKRYHGSEALLHVNKMVRDVTAELDNMKRAEGDGPGSGSDLDPGPGPAPNGIPQYNWDDCYKKAREAPIEVMGPIGGKNDIRVTNMPPICMNLAAFLGGADANGTATPVPCGSDCIMYVNMSYEYYEGVRSMINTKTLALQQKMAAGANRAP